MKLNDKKIKYIIRNNNRRRSHRMFSYITINWRGKPLSS